MGIVDIGKCAIMGMTDKLQPAGGTHEFLQRRHRDRRGNAGRYCKACCHQRVGNLEIAGKRNVNLENIVADMHFGNLLVTEMLDALQRQEIPLAADGAYVLPGITGSGNRLFRPWIIGKDDRRGTLRQQIPEQPHLGGHVILNRRMIVHMVAAKIGEGGGRQPDAIKAELIEAMA